MCICTCVCEHACVRTSVCCHLLIHTGRFFSLCKIYILLSIHNVWTVCVYVRVDVCVCEDHRPPHQMIQNHLTPISRGALVMPPNSPSATWQLFSQTIPLTFTATHPVSPPPPSLPAPSCLLLIHRAHRNRIYKMY